MWGHARRSTPAECAMVGIARPSRASVLPQWLLSRSEYFNAARPICSRSARVGTQSSRAGSVKRIATRVATEFRV